MAVENLRGTEGKITDEMVAALRAEIGNEHPAKDQFNTECTRDGIRHWAEGIGDLNPLWLDDEYAKKTRFGGIIASPMFLYSCMGRAGKIGMPGIHAFHAGSRWVFHQPLRLYDTVHVSGALHDVIEKKSSFAKRSFLLVYLLSFRNQRGEMVASMYQNLIRTERDTAAKTGKYQGMQTHVWTDEELEAIYREIEAQELRGATPRYWEDVEVGLELRPLPKGPLTMSDVVAFKMGWGSHYAHHIRANETRYWIMKRHPGMPIRNRLNVPDCPEGVHMISDTAQAIGMPGFYDYGIQRAGWLQQLLTHWMGDDGWLKELELQVRRPSIEGDVQWCKGRVTGKKIEQGEHLVEFEIWCDSQRGEITTPGHAVVALPSKAG